MKTAFAADTTADLAACQQAATERFFKGSQALYQAFKHASLQQFPMDMAAIEAVFAANDSEALRRHAHNLKSALGMLGFEVQKQQALALELAALGADWPAAATAWSSLRIDLIELTSNNQRQV